MSSIQSDVMTVEAIDFIISKLKSSPAQVRKWNAKEIEDLYQYAFHFYQNGKYQEAVDFFRTLTGIDARDIHYWTGLAASLKMLREHEKAIDAYVIAALIETENPYHHAHAADCCFALGQIERGMLALDAAEILANNKNEYQTLLAQLAVIRQAWSNQVSDKQES